jgi:divalent metal cation (Fe/Co/Zn/Cd) transporter
VVLSRRRRQDGEVLVQRERHLRHALRLGYFTVAWNVTEGVVAIAAAVWAGSRALLGFGLDSGVESLSASVLIWRLRIEKRNPARAERVERQTLRLIGITFFVLAAFVGIESVRSLVASVEPEASPVGILLTVVSLIVMPVLARRKRQVATAMGSRAIEADSAQTRACAYLSVVVLLGLLLNGLFGWWWADPIAALFVVVFLVQEGREALSAEHVDDCCA